MNSLQSCLLAEKWNFTMSILYLNLYGQQQNLVYCTRSIKKINLVTFIDVRKYIMKYRDSRENKEKWEKRREKKGK